MFELNLSHLAAIIKPPSFIRENMVKEFLKNLKTNGSFPEFAKGSK